MVLIDASGKELKKELNPGSEADIGELIGCVFSRLSAKLASDGYEDGFTEQLKMYDTGSYATTGRCNIYLYHPL